MACTGVWWWEIEIKRYLSREKRGETLQGEKHFRNLGAEKEPFCGRRLAVVRLNLQPQEKVHSY